MGIREYLQVLGRRWRVVLTCLALGVLAATLLNSLAARTYQATAQVLVSADATSDQTQQYQGSAFTQARMKSYLTIATSPQVLAAVLSDLHLSMSSAQLKSEITADTPSDQTVVNLHVTDASAAQAAALANSLARAFSTTVMAFETPADSPNSTVKLLVTSPATAPTTPASPRVVLNLLIGLFAGLVLGLTLAALREVLDNTVKAPEQVTDLVAAPLLGTIVHDGDGATRPIAVKANARGPRAEGFRRLRTNLQFVDVDRPPRVIAVTSAVSGEGKSATAINLAAVLAEAGHRVALVDTDLRRPSIATTLGLVGKVGLTNALIGQLSLREAFQEVGDSLFVVASGPLPPNPSELLASDQTRSMIRSLAAEVDYVILDTAPLLPVADGAEIAAICDGSILVARWGETTTAQIARAGEALERVDARLLGVVLNRVPGREAAYLGYTNYSRSDDAAGHRRAGRTDAPADVSS